MDQIDNTSRKYQLDLSILPRDIPIFKICDQTSDSSDTSDSEVLRHTVR
jgi:hypothetical protein